MSGRISVLVSGSGSNMTALAEACDSGRVPGSVVQVVADRPCGGIETAAGRGIETAVVTLDDFDDRAAWNKALRATVESARPDLVVLAGFMRILSPEFVDGWPGRLINIHPALLPAFPGAHGVRDALQYGVKVTGTTVHLVDYEVDHGPILLQEAIPVLPGDDEGSLHERIKALEHRLLPEACRMLLEGRVRFEGTRAVVEDVPDRMRP